MTASLYLAIFAAKPWEVPKDNQQRWARSALTGISTAVIIVSFFILLGLSEARGTAGGIFKTKIQTHGRLVS
jgi:hypothetical protein